MEKVVLKVFRLNPAKEATPSYRSYEVPYKKGVTVLDALLYVKEKLDHTLALRYSCRMGLCGSCGMVVNGKPRLACHTQIHELKSEVVVVEPLRNLPIIRDLVVDLSPFFKLHRMVKPYLMRRDVSEQEEPSYEYLQTPKQLEQFLQFSYCIKCGLCYSACPTVATDRSFLGPQALAQAYRYMADVRDEGSLERLKVLDSSHGVWRCHFAGSCSAVCPKGVDPAMAVQLLRRYVMFSRKAKIGAPVYTPPRKTEEGA